MLTNCVPGTTISGGLAVVPLDQSHCAGDAQPSHVSIALIDAAKFSLPPILCCFGNSLIQAARLCPDTRMPSNRLAQQEEGVDDSRAVALWKPK